MPEAPSATKYGGELTLTSSIVNHTGATTDGIDRNQPETIDSFGYGLIDPRNPPSHLMRDPCTYALVWITASKVGSFQSDPTIDFHQL